MIGCPLWLDELPDQAVLDGLQPFPRLISSKLEPFPVDLDILDSYEPDGYAEYILKIQLELGHV